MTTTVVLPLAAVGAGDLGTAGGKAANLGELVRAGFAVPDGFVVPTAVYREAVRRLGPTGTAAGGGGPGSGRFAPDELHTRLATVALPPGLAEAVADAYQSLGGGAVAVRSSATAEDLPGAAFAGQQETFLDVVGADAVLDALRRCWASLWGDRAVAYRSRLTDVGEPEMAVVVQRMVPAEHAGVLFTADPVTGDRDVVVIEAAAGLGEAVVSGAVTPEHVTVDRRGRVRTAGAGGAGLPEPALVALAETGRRVAAHLGCPQDVEWAHAAGRTWLVQSRPLTVLPPAPRRVGRVRRAAGAITAELLPARPYPLDLTAWTVPGWFRILERMAAEIPGLRVDLGAMFVAEDAVLSELVPPTLRPTWRTLTTPVRLAPRLRRSDPARWTEDARFVRWEARLAELRATDPATVPWTALLGLARSAMSELDALVDVRIDHLPAALVALLRLRALLAVLGLSSELWPLLEGQPTRTRAANDALEAVAAEVRADRRLLALFREAEDDDLVAAVWGDDQADDPAVGQLRARLRAWLEAYGHRETTSAALLSAPTWPEVPALLLGSLRGLVVETGVRAERDPAEVERRVLARRRVRLTGTAPLLRRAARAGREGLVFREDSHFHALRVRPVVRAAVLEAGGRLAAAGVLATADDVWHLTLDELRALDGPGRLADVEVDRLRELVRRRAGRRAALGAAPLVSPATLAPRRSRPAADVVLTGAAGGGGRATGIVRVVAGPDDFARLRHGEVLVCPYTNPAWTPLFARAAAVVADAGSVASHAAIVAREYGIPAVMGTGQGTRLLSDGQVVVVDGDRGEVRLPDRGGRG